MFELHRHACHTLGSRCHHSVIAKWAHNTHALIINLDRWWHQKLRASETLIEGTAVYHILRKTKSPISATKHTVLEHLEQCQGGDVDLLRCVHERRVRVRTAPAPGSWENPVQSRIHGTKLPSEPTQRRSIGGSLDEIRWSGETRVSRFRRTGGRENECVRSSTRSQEWGGGRPFLKDED